MLALANTTYCNYMENAYEMIRLVIADDHKMLRNGLQHTFSLQKDFLLLATVADGEELILAVKKFQPDVIVTDLKMGEMDGTQACFLIREAFPEATIIVYSMYDNEELVCKMRSLGIKGYVLKNGDDEEIVKAIRIVNSGGEYFCSSIRKRSSQFFSSHKMGLGTAEKKQEFTAIELQIITLFCQGYSAKAVADKLKIKARMVQTHKEHIEDKMDVKGEVQIVVYALKNWLLY